MTSATANVAVIDTSVYVDDLRSRRFEKELLDLEFVVRCSAVVPAELRRTPADATQGVERKTLQSLQFQLDTKSGKML